MDRFKTNLEISESKIESPDVFISIQFACSSLSLMKLYKNGTMAFESMQRFNASVSSKHQDAPRRPLGFCTMLVLLIDWSKWEQHSIIQVKFVHWTKNNL